MMDVRRMPSLVAAAVVLIGAFLGAVPVEGRWCKIGDVYKNGNDYSTATIPKGCTTLSLDSDNIGASGAAAIAGALDAAPALTTLNMAINNIGASGATAIAEMLKVNTAITELTLYENKIGDGGATAIAEALKVNAVLEDLFLHNNIINDRAITDSILASLAKNQHSNRRRRAPSTEL